VDTRHPAIVWKLSGTTKPVVVVPVVGGVPVAIRHAQVVRIVVQGAAPHHTSVVEGPIATQLEKSLGEDAQKLKELLEKA
jgi:hypothetical protein